MPPRASSSARNASGVQRSGRARAASPAIASASAASARRSSVGIALPFHLDPQAAQLARERLAREADHVGRARDVPLVLAQPLEQVLALEARARVGEVP